MATSSMRIRLNLEEIICDPSVQSKRFWYLVDSKIVNNIEDVAHDVIAKFCLKNYAPHIQVVLNGFILPPWEKVEVLREDDEIRFAYYKEVETKRTKVKRRSKTCSKEVEGNKDIQNINATKKRKAGFQLSHEHELKKNHNKRLKSDKLTKIVNKDKSSSSDESSSSSEEDSAASNIRKTVNSNVNQINQLKKSAKNSSSSLVSKNIGSPKVHNTTAGKTKGKKSSSDSDTDSESETDSSSDDNFMKNNKFSLKKNVTKATKIHRISNIVDKSKPGVRKTVKQVSNESSNSDTSSDDSIDSKQGSKNVDSVTKNKRNVSFKKDIDVQSIKKESDDDSSSSSSSDISSEDNLKGSVNTKKINDSNEAVNSSSKVTESINEASPSKIVVGAQVGEKKKRKRRGRKRCRPKKKSNEQNTSTQATENLLRGRYSGYALVDAADRDIISVTPVSKNDVSSNSQMETDNKNKQAVSETSGNNEVKNYNGMSEHIGDRKVSKRYPVNPAQSDEVASSLDLSANLMGGVKVFSRNKKFQKKRSSFPLSEAQALSDMVSHKSFVFEDKDGSGDDLVMKPKGNPKGEADKPEAVKPVPPSKDYSSLPDLHGPPRIGDKIAYKILEMSDNYCPEVSDYKEALVKAYNPKDMTLELEILFTKGKSKSGRFDCVVEDEEEILTNIKEEVGTTVTLGLMSLMETKLVE